MCFGHFCGSLIVTLYTILPVFVVLSLIVRIDLLNEKLVEAFMFPQTKKTFKVVMVSNQKLQNKMIENASQIYLHVHDIIALMNGIFGYLVSYSISIFTM